VGIAGVDVVSGPTVGSKAVLAVGEEIATSENVGKAVVEMVSKNFV
jgi:hypothetical protein